jgi:hypothetical protein
MFIPTVQVDASHLVPAPGQRLRQLVKKGPGGPCKTGSGGSRESRSAPSVDFAHATVAGQLCAGCACFMRTDKGRLNIAKKGRIPRRLILALVLIRVLHVPTDG